MTENTHRVEVFVEVGLAVLRSWLTYVEAEADAEVHREVCVAQAAIRHSDFGMDSRVSDVRTDDRP